MAALWKRAAACPWCWQAGSAGSRAAVQDGLAAPEVCDLLAWEVPDGGQPFGPGERKAGLRRVGLAVRGDGDNGIAAGKPVNRAATFIARSFGAQFSLYGTVVIVGLDSTAALVNLSPAQVGAILKKIGAPAT